MKKKLLLSLLDVGSNLAKAFADAHESETADGVDKTMDLNIFCVLSFAISFLYSSFV